MKTKKSIPVIDFFDLYFLEILTKLTYVGDGSIVDDVISSEFFETLGMRFGR